MFISKKEEILAEIRSHSPSSISPNIRELLFNNNINYCLAPETLGGCGLGYHAEYCLIRDSANISPSFGWLVFQFAGNVPRVFSLIGQRRAREISVEFGQRLLIAYDTNPTLCRFKNVEYTDKVALSGQMNFGTLATDATHFGFSGFLNGDTDNKVFCLVQRDEVEVLDGQMGIRMQGTGTCSYRTKGILQIGRESIVDMASSVEDVFSEYYRFPRSPIKHMAWSVGCLKNLLSFVEGRREEATEALIMQLDSTIEETLTLLDAADRQTDPISGYFDVLSELQSAVLKLALKIHLGYSRLYFTSEDFRNSLMEITSASLHTTMRATYDRVSSRSIEEMLTNVENFIVASR